MSPAGASFSPLPSLWFTSIFSFCLNTFGQMFTTATMSLLYVYWAGDCLVSFLSLMMSVQFGSEFESYLPV